MESNIQFGSSNLTNTSILKNSPPCPIPEIQTLSDADLRRFVPTGITVKLPTPFVKISSTALFGVNIDGFVPPYNIHTASGGSPSPIFMNMFPVQATEEGTRLGVKIYQEMSQLIPITNFLSHRFISGNVGIALRVSSNTAMTGNFYVSQLSGGIRDYYTTSASDTNAEAYKGLRFNNASHSGIDYAQGACSILDVSLNRNLSITPIRRDVTQKTDLAQKMVQVITSNLKANSAQLNTYNTFASQFPEDWLLFTPISDFSGIAANTISFTFFFDYSRVNFYTPMLAMLPFPPTPKTGNTREILDFSATFNDKFSNTPLSDWVFLAPVEETVSVSRKTPSVKLI